MSVKKSIKIRTKPHRNLYREEQAAQRKAANLARRGVLKEERKKALGDTIRSLPTPFISSLASGGMPEEGNIQNPSRNYMLVSGDLELALENSKKLSKPYVSDQMRQKEDNFSSKPKSGPNSLLNPLNDSSMNPFRQKPDPTATLQERIALHELDHINATRALNRISALSNGSSSDRTRRNLQRCISTFGRHATDSTLPPKAASVYNPSPVSKPKLRSGPDTGSSEVQIAILTAKINALADNLLNKDKQNKRGLRVMVHRRQKLLIYLQRRERGGPRWQNLVEKLGIQEAMYKGEIGL